MWSIDEPNKNEHFYRDLHLIILDFNQALTFADDKDMDYRADINRNLGYLHLVLDDVDWCQYFSLSCEQGNESCTIIDNKDLGCE